MKLFTLLPSKFFFICVSEAETKAAAENESIELSDDDDDTQDDAAKKVKSRRQPTDCLNVECQYGEEYIDNVPSFVLSYYKVRRRKGLKICCQCYSEASSYFSVIHKLYIKIFTFWKN